MGHKKKKRNCTFISIFNIVNCGSCDDHKHDSHQEIIEAALENTDIKALIEAVEAAEDEED